MTENEHSGRIAGSSTLDTRYLKRGSTTLLVPLPTKLAELIGMVVVQWGAFEVRMDAAIEAFHTNLTTQPPPNWQRLPFKKRKELFKDISNAYCVRMGFFGDISPFAKICGKSADLQWRRNVVAHGTYRIEPPKTDRHGDTVHFTAWGRIRGKDVLIEITEDVLTKLFHDIAHLNGELMHRLVKRGASLNNIELRIEDNDLLQGPESGSFRFVPIRSNN